MDATPRKQVRVALRLYPATRQAKALFQLLMDRADATGLVQIDGDQDELALLFEVDVRTIKRWVAELVEVGMIEPPERELVGGLRRGNVYRLRSPSEWRLTPEWWTWFHRTPPYPTERSLEAQDAAERELDGDARLHEIRERAEVELVCERAGCDDAGPG